MYYDYSAMSKSLKCMSNCLKIAETSVILMDFNGVLYHVHSYTYYFLPPLYMNEVPEKNISWSVTINNQNLSSQWYMK
jgi:hypothetical protein